MLYHHILSIAVTIKESETDMDMILRVQAIQHPLRFLIQLHRLRRLRTVFDGKRGKPRGTTAVTAVDVCDGGKTRRKAPRVEEVQPIDVGCDLVNSIMQCLYHSFIFSMFSCAIFRKSCT